MVWAFWISILCRIVSGNPKPLETPDLQFKGKSFKLSVLLTKSGIRCERTVTAV